MTTGQVSPGAAGWSWWRHCIAADTGAARRSRAQLRRAGSVAEALTLRATHELHRGLVDAGHDLRRRGDGPDRLALIAVALAHVTDDCRESAAARFGQGGPAPSLSELRFDTLVRTREPRRLMRRLARALGIAGGSANVRRLAEDLYWWGERSRTRWCFEYYGATRIMSELKEHR